MNPNSKLLLDEMHRLFKEQKTQIDERFAESDRKLDERFTDNSRKLDIHFTEVDDSITNRIAEFDNTITKRLADSDLNWEQRITDSELRQSALITDVGKRHADGVSLIGKSDGALEAWRQESEGAVDDVKLKVDKLTKYWDRSFLDQAAASTGVISSAPPILEQTAACSPASNTAARPSGHHVFSTTRADGIEETSPQSHSPANGMQLTPHVGTSMLHGVVPKTHHHTNHHNDNGRLSTCRRARSRLAANPPRLPQSLLAGLWLVTKLRISRTSVSWTQQTCMQNPQDPQDGQVFHGLNLKLKEAPVHLVHRGEMADSNKRSEFHAHDRGASFKSAMRTAVPTTRPLPIAAAAGDKLLAKATAPDTDDKLSKLRSYRQARDLCDVCAEKWFRDHNSASFLTASVAEQLPQLLRTPLTASVKVANGHLLQCTEAILGCCFSLGDYQFQHDLHILSLESYDLILGIDSLELYSPMEVHWQAKWLSIPYKGDTVVLQGLTSVSDTELVVQLLAVEAPNSNHDAVQLPDDIAALLAEFPSVFQLVLGAVEPPQLGEEGPEVGHHELRGGADDPDAAAVEGPGLREEGVVAVARDHITPGLQRPRRNSSAAGKAGGELVGAGPAAAA
ncbi:unnamed protein product [Miscanthus lutarioriparius]|uniref:Uncharacterized protein n=1 Tax=Miscanthus lutarioriparius TaxID=422564 RepID=A0A811QFZ8_9POAL|nr:unnamed protein product [Miscanthus lutarioriparius]